ncbi:unnamed protein product [Effrenium voratum]|uniref:N-acetyltransferase domain-containing protein n=1 Tax=Effrenium voratum TaxID=2562239 RepID=A0AA36NLB0_9DINO|nr:unnamed protein product [Effrenium voratum]CAJ1455431.1 unnamed protein product [Effrenium voratum]
MAAVVRGGVLETDDDNNVVYRVMEVPDIPAAIEAVALAFYEGEPVMLASGGTLRDWQRFAEMYVPRMAAEGHTVLAVEKASGQIIGAFLNEDFNNPDPQDFEHFLESSDGDWRPIIGMVEDLEESLMKAHSIPLQASERPAGQFFHLWMIGVSSSARGRGVATKLFHHSLALAKARGFKLAFAECTGAVSTHIFQRFAPRLDSFVSYETWDKLPTSPELKQLKQSGHPGMSMLSVDLA